MKSQGSTCVVIGSTIDRKDYRRKHYTFLKISVGIFVSIILLNCMWSTVMIFNNTLILEKNYKLLEKISQHIAKTDFDDLAKTTSISTVSTNHPEVTERPTSKLTISTEETSLATTISSTLWTTFRTSSQQSTSDSESNYTTKDTPGTTLRASTTIGTTLRASTTTGTTLRTSTTTGTTTMISTIATPITSSTPEKPKKQPYKMLRDLHNPKPIKIKCVNYCRRPPIIKSNMTVTVDVSGNRKFFEAYVLGSEASLALDKASYFALEELYPSNLTDVHTPADLSQEIPHCTTLPIDSNIKKCK